MSGHSHSVDAKSNTYLGSLCKVVAKHQVFALLGTQEEVAGVNQYTTAVLVGSDGAVIGTYRKRRPVRNTAAGNQIGVWDTAIGRIAVLICFDIENREILEETLAAKPDLILNPIWIPQPSGVVNVHAAWNASCESMARKFEVTCRDNHIALVRVDMSANFGASGTSIACDWFQTIYAPSRTECCFMYVLDGTAKFEGPPPERDRTERVDNTGNRYAAKQIQAYDHIPVTSLTFIDRNRFVSASETGVLKLFKCSNRELITSVSLNTNVSSTCLMAQNNRRDVVSIGTGSGSILLWDLSSNSPKILENYSSKSPILRILNAEPNELCICSRNRVEIVDIRSPSSPKSLGTETDELCSMDYCGDRYAPLGSSGIKIFDRRNSSTPLHCIAGGPYTSVLLRDSMCYAGDTQGTVFAFNLESERQIESGKHSDAVRSLSALSSSLFVSASSDSTMILWRYNNKTKDSLTAEHVFRSHTHAIRSLSSGEMHLATGDQDGLLTLWEYQQNRIVRPFSALE